LITSPARTALFRRLTGADSFVWLVVKSGDADADAAIVRQLETRPGPAAVAGDAERTDPAAPENPPTAACRTSVIAIEPDAPAEALLLGLLRVFAPSVHKGAKGPIAVPVFGRGRALEQFPAVDLTAAVIGEVRAFLSGFCSCQIKELNPGKDLFIPEDWDEALAQQPEVPKP
jgi:hypothetical protein